MGQYVGHTAPKTKEILKRAMGGVLFVDEACYLYRPENERDYGQESIEMLLQVMENQRDDLVVILAGYKERMKTFFEANPGFHSRIAHHVEFPDFTQDELLQIGELMLRQQMYHFDDAARETIPHPDLTYLTQASHGKDSGIALKLEREDGRPVDILTVDGAVSPAHAAALEQVIWQHLPGVRPLSANEFGDFSDRTATRHSDPLALTQLLLTYHLLRQYHDVPQHPFAAPVAALSRLQSPVTASQTSTF